MSSSIGSPGDIPDEDRYLFEKDFKSDDVKIGKSRNSGCRHEYYDFYGGSGTDRDNINIAYQYFYCKFCLHIKLVKFDQSIFRLNDDLEEERREKGL